MGSVLVALLFAALFTVWWVHKPEWSRNHHGNDHAPRQATFAPSMAPPPALTEMTLAGRFRPDIEGLRAIAVLMVLVYHADFEVMAGGFVGVDVFFVLSGFLITSLLLRELASTGTVSLANFWARRARRLLPASGMALVATLIAARFLLDGLSQADLARDALAACLFVVNLRFVAVGTDYLTSELPPSPLLHFWSLAVEEQFYLLWPALLMGLVRFARLTRRSLAVVIGAMWVASFAACVWFTSRSQPWAFFMLPARAWELLTGAALALAGGTLLRVGRQLNATLGWLGLGAIVAVGVVFDDRMSFPGFAAFLPVVATMLVINAGGSGAADGPMRLLQTRPLQWIGARSYAIYLWHFPMLILADRKWGPLSPTARVALLVGSVAVAAISFHFVENPIRHSPALALAPARSLVMGAWIALVGVGGAALLLNNPPRLDAGVVAAAPTLVAPASSAPLVAPASSSSSSSTIVAAGAPTTAVTTTTAIAQAVDASRDNPARLAGLIAANLPVLEEGVRTAKVPSNLTPGLGKARDDLPALYDNGCILDLGESSPKNCIYGDAGGSKTIVLFGDSHAAEWMPGLHQVAVQNGWRLVVHVKKACPTAEIPTEKDPNRTDCVPWRAAVLTLIEQMQPELVVMSAYRYKAAGSAIGRDPDAVWREGLDLTVSKLRAKTKRLLLLGDSATPLEDVPSCLAGNITNVARCMNSREGAVRPNRLAVERDIAAAYDADFVPTSDWLCTDSACPVIVGNVLMYRDNSHITATAAVFLAPYLEAAIAPLMG